MVVIFAGLTIIPLVAADLVIRWRMSQRTKAPASLADAVVDLLMPRLQAEHFSLPGGLFFHRGTAGRTCCSPGKPRSVWMTSCRGCSVKSTTWRSPQSVRR
jgi:hypothetical protein